MGQSRVWGFNSSLIECIDAWQYVRVYTRGCGAEQHEVFNTLCTIEIPNWVQRKRRIAADHATTDFALHL